MKNSKVCSSPCFEKSTIKTQLNLELGWLAYINDDVIGDLVYSEQQQKIISENNIDLTLNSPDHLDYETPSRLIKIAACKFMGVFLEKRARDQQEISSELILPNWMNQDLSNLFGEDYKEYRSIDLAYFYSLLPALHNEIASNSIETEFQEFIRGRIAPRTIFQILWRKYVAHDLYKNGIATHTRYYWEGLRIIKRALALNHTESLIFLTKESESIHETLQKRGPESKEQWNQFVEIDGFFFLDDEIPLSEPYITIYS